MAGEIRLDQSEKMATGGEPELLENLEEKVGYLLTKYQELKRERDELAVGLDMEREKMAQMEMRLEFFSQEREKLKARIDQLLQRLKSIDI